MPSFLSALTRGDVSRYELVNERTGGVVSSHVLTAFDSASRRTGLLKHTSMPAGHALIIAPCSSIHMFFMKFAIDVAFVAKDGRILKIRAGIRPWRMTASLRAFAAIELQAGALAACDTRAGDCLLVRERGALGPTGPGEDVVTRTSASAHGAGRE